MLTNLQGQSIQHPGVVEMMSNKDDFLKNMFLNHDPKKSKVNINVSYFLRVANQIINHDPKNSKVKTYKLKLFSTSC